MLVEEAILLRPPLFKSDMTNNGTIFHIVSVLDIPEYGYMTPPEKIIMVDNSLKHVEKYELKPNDVVMSLAGTVGKVGIVPPNLSERWIASSNITLIRFYEQQSSKSIAFTMFMRSRYGRNIINDMVHGKIPIISKKSFERILIPALTPHIYGISQELFQKEQDIFLKRATLLDDVEHLRNSYL